MNPAFHQTNTENVNISVGLDHVIPKPPMKKMKRALVLFSDTELIGQHLKEKGFEVHYLDRDPQVAAANPENILTWNCEKEFQRKYFDVIAARIPNSAANATIA